VFSDDLPEMPHERAIEFTIELRPGTAPIEKASYKMSPVELKELKIEGPQNATREGGECEPIKIPRGNSIYDPNQIQRVSLVFSQDHVAIGKLLVHRTGLGTKITAET
jgi:hypothetical protein